MDENKIGKLNNILGKMNGRVKTELSSIEGYILVKYLMFKLEGSGISSSHVTNNNMVLWTHIAKGYNRWYGKTLDITIKDGLFNILDGSYQDQCQNMYNLLTSDINLDLTDTVRDVLEYLHDNIFKMTFNKNVDIIEFSNVASETHVINISTIRALTKSMNKPENFVIKELLKDVIHNSESKSDDVVGNRQLIYSLLDYLNNMPINLTTIQSVFIHNYITKISGNDTLLIAEFEEPYKDMFRSLKDQFRYSNEPDRIELLQDTYLTIYGKGLSVNMGELSSILNIFIGYKTCPHNGSFTKLEFDYKVMNIVIKDMLLVYNKKITDYVYKHELTEYHVFLVGDALSVINYSKLYELYSTNPLAYKELSNNSTC